MGDMPRLRILPVPNFNPDVYARDLRTRRVFPALGSQPLLPVPPVSATSKCTGGEYHCPDGWKEIPWSPQACLPGQPCPTYEARCRQLVPPHKVLPAKQAILATLPPVPPGNSYEIERFDKGNEQCEWQCPEGSVPGKPEGAPYLPPPCVAPGSPEAADPEWLGVPQQTWAIGAAAVGIALAVGIGALLLSRRRSALPNSAELAAEYLPRAPEAALMLMPPAIPSYLAYRYAIGRMHPEDAEFVEGWRDFAPEGASDEDDLYFEDDYFDE
jgi:hypothetical protein